MSVRAFVCGCQGTALSDAERSFVAETKPWGLILFKRNIGTPEAVRALVDSFREAVGRAEAPVLIDQEGGRVQRLGPPHWPRYPAAARYGEIGDGEAARAAAWAGGRLIAADLAAVGITIDCAPVLDIPVEGGSEVVGNRAFGRSPDAAVPLAAAFAAGLEAGGILPVIKHMPGHGRAYTDSHFELPRVEAGREALARDFAPFEALAGLPIGMTGHVLFTALDPLAPATTSALIISEVIRGRIGFGGLLLTDDLSMQALQGTLGERAAAALAAGCDIALHCNGKLDEAAEVAAVAPILDGQSAERAARALARRRPPQPFDAEAARARIDALLPAA